MNFRMFAAAALVAAGAALPVHAGDDDMIRLRAAQDVTTTMDALQKAVEGAGAHVFARVDHAGGARKVGMELRDEQLLIFGNPKLGTSALQDNPMAGLLLPLRVVAYQDAQGQTWLTYEDPGAMLGRLEGISDDAPYIAKMRGALKKLTAKAAGN